PGLGDAAARRERRLGVKNFADRADAGFSEMRLEAVEEKPRHRAIMGVDLEPSIDERADQPSPYRALVIGGIAGTHIAEIARLVLGLARRQRTQPNRRHTSFASTAVTTASQCSRSRTGCSSAIAKIWFGRNAVSSPFSPSTTSQREPPAACQK